MNQSKQRTQNKIIGLLDTILFVAAYYISGLIWLVFYKNLDYNYSINQINTHLITVLVSILLVAVVFDNRNTYFLKRNSIEEVRNVLVRSLMLGACIAILQLLIKSDIDFSRGIFILTIIVGFVMTIIGRIAFKKYLKSRKKNKFNTSQMVLITTSDLVDQIIMRISRKQSWDAVLSGIIIVDKDLTGQSFNHIPVVANVHTMMNYIKNEIVDETYIHCSYGEMERMKPTIDKLEDMGVTVYINLDIMGDFLGVETHITKVGDTVTAMIVKKIYDYRLLMVKRVIDIIGALVGLVILGVVSIFVAPCIKLESKGPVLFKQKRVGKNGRYFDIYKFRSMYIDAEERKKELMAKNEMNGLMFKMENDPRITKVGKFIRKTSIDELPQFINILKGDMSLVGTRPPTVNEFKQYDIHHKRRLSMKPGVTGMWQAYGRNTVSDFEEVVKMDVDYIDNWSLLLDIKILFKTVATVLTEGGK